MLPSGVPPAAAESARDTLGAAVVAGDGLPGGLGAEVVDAARAAFADALALAATLSAAVVIGAALLIVALLRRPPVRPGYPPDPALAGGRPC